MLDALELEMPLRGVIPAVTSVLGRNQTFGAPTGKTGPDWVLSVGFPRRMAAVAASRLSTLSRQSGGFTLKPTLRPQH